MSKKDSKQANEYWLYPSATRALEIALYYGFSPSEAVDVEKSDREAVSGFSSEHTAFIRPEEKAALLRYWFLNDKAQQTVSLATLHSEHRKNKTIEYSLDIIGTNRSIADATLIKTAFEIVRAEGHTNIALELNTVGDRESFARYTREITAYYRKHAHEIHPECKAALKKDVYAGLSCEHAECATVKERVPYPMNFLSEPSRAYFMELLEILETSDIPFSLNNCLLANRECAMHTIFRIVAINESKTETIAHGCRWGLIGKKIGLKKDVQGISATIAITKTEKQEKTLKLRKPQCYFIQMGQEAKLKSLRVIETLRQSKIPVYHSLTKDKLTAQLFSAESLKVPYIMIMGQKECLENTVLIREMSNRSQETIKIEQLSVYLKKVIG